MGRLSVERGIGAKGKMGSAGTGTRTLVLRVIALPRLLAEGLPPDLALDLVGQLLERVGQNLG
jgi:hypothetical protein